MPSYTLTVETGILEWNGAFYKTFGYSTGEQANSVEWWTTHVHPDDAMAVSDTLNRLFDPTVKQWSITYRFRKADGSYLGVRDDVTITRGLGGRAERLHGIMTIV